jgi:GT2 family glycosyltransferase
MLRGKFPQAKMILLDRNVGCAGGRNIGALNAQGEILFFLDDDCVIAVDAIEKALPYFYSDDKLAVVTPQIIEPDAGKVLFIYGNSIRYTHMFTGVSAIRRSFFCELGLYPNDFVYGSEEADLAIRILDKKRHILYAPQVKVFHYPASKRNRNWEMEQYLQNAMRVLLKYAPIERVFAGILIKPLTYLSDAIRNHSLGGWIKAVVKIPVITVQYMVSNQRKPLGWKPFLLSEYLISNSISSLEDLAQVEEMQLRPSLLKLLWSRRKRFHG